MAQEIKSTTGKFIGKITDESPGQRAYAYNGRFLGEYKSHERKTYNHRGDMIAEGNVLAGLIYGSAQ